MDSERGGGREEKVHRASSRVIAAVVVRGGSSLYVETLRRDSVTLAPSSQRYERHNIVPQTTWIRWERFFLLRCRHKGLEIERLVTLKKKNRRGQCVSGQEDADVRCFST